MNDLSMGFLIIYQLAADIQLFGSLLSHMDLGK